MRKMMVGFFMILCCGALLAGGCAKKEIVKGEGEMAAPAAKAPEPAPPIQAPVKEEVVQAQAVKEAPAAVKEEAAIAAKAAEVQQIELDKIYFDFDKYVLTDSSRKTLSKNAEYLLKNKSVKVQIEGNCDERGSDEYNLALGEKRAKSAMNYLVTLGVPAEQLSIISYGKEKPVDTGHNEAAWAKNRRDEFVTK